MKKSVIVSAVAVLAAAVTIAFAQFPDYSPQYGYEHQLFSAPGSLSFTGNATSWAVVARAGDCTFDIDGGDSILVLSGDSMADSFNWDLKNPTFNVTALTAGTCAVTITGGMIQ